MVPNYKVFKKFIDFRERERGRERRTDKERNIHLFHISVHSLTDSFMCPDWGSNPQPWCIWTML